MKLSTLFARERPAVAPPPVRADLFLLRSGTGAWLAVEGGEVVMAAATTPDSALYLCIPKSGPQASFLIARDGRRLGVEGDGLAGPAISGRVRRVPGGRLELRHPVASVRHLGVMTGIPVGRVNRVLFDRVGDRVLDRFEPHPVGVAVLAPAGLALLRELARAARPPMTADGLMALLQAGTVRLALAEALIRVLPADELAVLARSLVSHAADLALIRRAIPDDPWLNQDLPRLLAWCAEGRKPTRSAVSPASEHRMAVLQSGDLRPQVGLALHALARQTISPRRVAAVLATARNEGPYLLDWIAHHRAVGFDHVVIYSNDNDDGSDELLGRLADAGEITWVRNELSPAARAQWKAYGHAFKALPDLLDYRWTLVADLDEYFSFRTDLFGCVADVVGWHEHQGVDALALRWLTYVGGRRDVWRDEPCTQRFVHRQPAVSPLFKSLVRSNKFWDSHCHFPYPTMDAPFAYRLEDGGLCHHMGKLKGIQVPQDAVSADHAWIAHYMYRSAAEALAKVARGSATEASRDRQETERLHLITTRFLAMADDPGLVEDRRTLVCAPGLVAQRDRLRALPGVRDYDRAIKQDFVRRLRALSDAYPARTGSAGQDRVSEQFMAVLAAQGQVSIPAARPAPVFSLVR